MNDLTDLTIYNRARRASQRIPPSAIYVGRSSLWGNPYRIGPDGSREDVIAKYRLWLGERLREDRHFLDPLRGRSLVCHCWPLRPCHAELLLQQANRLSEAQLLTIYEATLQLPLFPELVGAR